MVHGVCAYPEDNETIYISSETARKLDATFAMKPLFLDHIPEDYNIEDLENTADGYVLRSFYNQHDGKHWAEFIAITDRAHKAVRDGFKVSNSYFIEEWGAGGTWHDVPYNREVIQGSYDHLALVQTPRYEESVILTPEQFASYNNGLQAELLKVANSKGVQKMKFNFFKREKVANSSDLEGMMIELPKSKVEVTLEKIINEADSRELEKGKKKTANETDLVVVDETEMSVGELVAKFKEVSAQLSEAAKEVEEVVEEITDEETVESFDDEDDIDMDDALVNESEEKAKKEKEEKATAAAKAKANAKKLQNAHREMFAPTEVVIETNAMKIARGKERY